MGKDAKYVVWLSVSERLGLEMRLSQVRTAKVLRARMLLKADADGPGWCDEQIAEAFEVSLSTVHRLRERFVQKASRPRSSASHPAARSRVCWMASKRHG